LLTIHYLFTNSLVTGILLHYNITHCFIQQQQQQQQRHDNNSDNNSSATARATATAVRLSLQYCDRESNSSTPFVLRPQEQQQYAFCYSIATARATVTAVRL